MDIITDSLHGVVNNLKEECIFAIKSTLNTTSSDPRHQIDYVNDKVREVEDVTCPGERADCNRHGTCRKSTCFCDAGICDV